jgi:hypothetical protein
LRAAAPIFWSAAPSSNQHNRGPCR